VVLQETGLNTSRLALSLLASLLGTVLAFGCEAGDRAEALAAQQATAVDVAPAVVSQWRQCELDEGPLHCGPDLDCDMFRNQCVRHCAGGDCCGGVSCPEPSLCVRSLGRCGNPAGTACFDLGTTWWTGRDVAAGTPAPAGSAKTVRFVVHNQRSTPLYFQSTTNQQLVRFDLYGPYGDSERRLELAENHFCSSPCPAQGPVLEVDCGRPPRFVQGIPAGAAAGFSWSGNEEVWNLRVCDGQGGRYCQVTRASLPGRYTVEVCAHTAIEGGTAAAGDDKRLEGAVLAGERDCRRVTFTYPTPAPVDIDFGLR
jgi:hypothetical protein